ncbi:MAG: SMP-30/gluconolactonase/LRE family protein [Pseudomonadota bacterium]
MKAECVVDCRNHLGEGAYWDDEAGLLWWLDVPQPSKLFALDPSSAKVESYDMPEMIASMARWHGRDGLLIASHGGLNFWSKSSGLEHLKRPEPAKPFNRCNDGAADRKGRFWFGTMQNNLAPDGTPLELIEASGTLYRLDPDLSLHAMESDIMISNTVCWSPDASTMYFCDTATGWISAYDFDEEAGTIANKRQFASFDRGVPDGSTVDAEGGLWSARWDGSCVVRFSADGSVDRVVEVPCPLVTSCAFGGKDLDTLYITTARYGQDEDALAETPTAGSLFAVKPGVKGVADGVFAR